MSLREAINHTLNSHLKTNNISLHNSRTTSVRIELEKIFSSPPRLPSSEDLQSLYAKFISADSLQSWENITKKEWMRASWILWYGEPNLISNKSFFDRYYKFCSHEMSSLQLKSLIHLYLRHFDKDFANKEALSQLIRSKLKDNSLLNTCRVWKERDDEYKLFNSDKDSSSASHKYINSDASTDHFLASCGLTGELASSGFSTSFYLAALQYFKDNIVKSRNALKLLDKIKDLAIKADGGFRYENLHLKSKLADTLLLPWISTKPEERLLNEITTLLLNNFKDPRLHPQDWFHVDESAKSVLRRWLAGATLEQFFSIIDDMALDDHWKYRRKFWKAYFDEGYIDDAWIALSSAVNTSALRAFGDNYSAARLTGGVMQNHSALIFKIGDLTICDWSHNGKCRAWKKDSPDAPQLYKAKYKGEELKSPSEKIHSSFQEDGISHMASDHLSWQRKLSDFIHYNTGIKMPEGKYRT